MELATASQKGKLWPDFDPADACLPRFKDLNFPEFSWKPKSSDLKCLTSQKFLRNRNPHIYRFKLPRIFLETKTLRIRC